MSAWLVPMLASAALTSYISYIYNQKANTALVMQQQRVDDLQSFRESGAELDQALSGMSDAIVDGSGLDEAKRNMRKAITKNISDAVAVRHILGSATDEYIDGLANLREVVDQTETIDSGRDLWQTSINLMEKRRQLVANAEQKALNP